MPTDWESIVDRLAEALTPDCRCPRCLVIGRPKPLTKEQAKAHVERFMRRVKIVHEGTHTPPTPKKSSR